MKIDLKLPGDGHLKIEKGPMSEDTLLIVLPITALVVMVLAFVIFG